MARVSKARRAECVARLAQLVKPGDTVYTTLRHVSRLGMMRVIDLHAIIDGSPVRLATYAADALEWPYNDKHEGVRVDGAGMDMGFHLVYSLAHVLWHRGWTADEKQAHELAHPAGRYSNYTEGYSLTARWM